MAPAHFLDDGSIFTKFSADFLTLAIYKEFPYKRKMSQCICKWLSFCFKTLSEKIYVTDVAFGFLFLNDRKVK